jgi:hypothetical protein
MALRSALALAGVLTFVPVTAHATIARAVAFEEKVENAASIVVGKCVAQQSKWDEARNWILTYSTFEIEKTIKGFPAQQITIVTPGGTVGHIAQEVIGVPKFRQGDEHVLFVRNSQAGPTVLYLEQGDYRVEQERGEKVVKAAASATMRVDTGRGAAMAVEPDRTLRDFEGSVRETMRKQDVQKMEMVERQKRAQSSIWSQLQRNRVLVGLAIIGAALASWQLYKRW